MADTDRTTDPVNIPSQGSLHTPGPWHVRDLHPGRCTFNIGTNPNDPYEGEVAVVFRAGRHVQTHHEANARLIAAAPDLLASLKEMGDWIAGGLQASGDAWPDERCLKHTEEIAARARAAVDKAEGRDTKCRCGERGCSECGEDPHAYGFVR